MYIYWNQEVADKLSVDELIEYSLISVDHSYMYVIECLKRFKVYEARIKTLESMVRLLDDELSLVKEKLKSLEKRDERAKYLD